MQSQSGFSYPEVGATAKTPPAGYNIDHNRVLVGHGEGAWERAVNAIRGRRMFRIPWLRLYWPSAPIRSGTDVVVCVRHFGFYSLNACRIVYLIDEEIPDRRYGFAYGTLPEHAERGEERFSVEWHREDDSVWYDVLAFSRPNELMAKIAYPLARGLQRQFAAASKLAMLDAVRQ